jgi:hypothetical protein
MRIVLPEPPFFAAALSSIRIEYEGSFGPNQWPGSPWIVSPAITEWTSEIRVFVWMKMNQARNG